MKTEIDFRIRVDANIFCLIKKYFCHHLCSGS